jgi:hypothetical protein
MAQYSFYANTGGSTGVFAGDFEVRILSVEWINNSENATFFYLKRQTPGTATGGSAITVAPVDGRSPPPSATVRSGSMSFSGAGEYVGGVYVGGFSTDLAIYKDFGHGVFQPPLDLTIAPGDSFALTGEIIVFFEEMRLSQSR